MLEALYGKVAREAKVSIPARLDSYEATPAFEPLQKIYTALQAHRGFERFAMTKTLNRVDFLICASGLVVEFDESQHFTYPRYLSLANYPKDLEIGYNRERWMTLALKFDCHDNDPPHRDEQRAWYDTLRLIREQKRQHDLSWFASCLEKSEIIPDLIVFPEAFEAIAPERPFLGREMFRLHPAVQDIIDKYRHFCSRFNTNAIVGVAASYGGVEKLNGAGNDQYGLIIPRQGEPVDYHKHSTSVQNAFFDEDWNLRDSFPVVEVSGVRVGLSICHDSYLSFIPRVLKKKGTTIWVNPSFCSSTYLASRSSNTRHGK